MGLNEFKLEETQGSVVAFPLCVSFFPRLFMDKTLEIVLCLWHGLIMLNLGLNKDDSNSFKCSYILEFKLGNKPPF